MRASRTVPGGRRVHTFIRLPNGNVLATYQFGDTTDAGQTGRTRRVRLAGPVGPQRIVARRGVSRRAYSHLRARRRAGIRPRSDDQLADGQREDRRRHSGLATVGPQAAQDARGSHRRRRFSATISVRDAPARRRLCFHEQLRVRFLPHHRPHNQSENHPRPRTARAEKLWLLRAAHRRQVLDHADRLRSSLRDDRHLRSKPSDGSRVIPNRHDVLSALDRRRPRTATASSSRIRATAHHLSRLPISTGRRAISPGTKPSETTARPNPA